MQSSSIEKQLSENGSFAACAKGNSMRPMLRDGRDMIMVEVPKTELRKYDIILYRVEERYVLHRIIAVKEHEYITRGDNTYLKEHIPKENVLGVLVAYNKNGKRHECTDVSHKLYSRFRAFTYPARRLGLFLKQLPGRLSRKISKKRRE